MEGAIDGFRGCGGCEAYQFSIGMVSGDGVAERFPDREGEHERRLSDCFAFPDGSILGGFIEKADTEICRRIAEGGDLVSAGAVGEEASFGIPE